MSTWEVIKTLFGHLGFYKKKTVLFIFIILAILIVAGWWQIFGRSRAQIAFADTAYDPASNQRTMDIEVQKNGQVLIDGQSKKALRFYEQYDELRILVFDSTGEYISSFKAVVHLPSPAKPDEVRQIVYAVHGVDSTRNYQSDSETLVYEATDISPQATLTIVADLPKGMITPNFSQKLEIYLRMMPVRIWLYVAIILPLVTLILMLFMILKRRKAQMIPIRGELGGPPDNLAPAIPGVLIDGAVGAREIAATLIDLAQRGYIYIISKGNGQFSFGIRRGTDFQVMAGLSDFEKELLEKIFLPKSVKSTLLDVQMRIGRHIFSRKIAKFYLAIYNDATKRGYFVHNPAKVHLTWKYIGVVLFFVCFLSFMLGAIFSADPKYGLFFWVGGMIAAAVIIRLSPFMPARTSQGDQELQEWLEFREYLTDRRPASGVQALQGKFEEYLAYSIVLGAEINWAQRFSQGSFKKPDWYESQEPSLTLDRFAQEIFAIIGYVAENLARSHEPTVE